MQFCRRFYEDVKTIIVLVSVSSCPEVRRVTRSAQSPAGSQETPSSLTGDHVSVDRATSVIRVLEKQISVVVKVWDIATSVIRVLE